MGESRKGSQTASKAEEDGSDESFDVEHHILPQDDDYDERPVETT